MRSLAFVASLFALFAPGPSLAQAAPAASDLLFETQDWQAVPPHATLLYRYQRMSNLASERVRGFSDTIRLLVTPGAAAGARNVQVEMFPATQRRPSGPFDDVTGNPILVLFLEQHLQTLAAALGANPRYLRNAIRTGLREKASVSPITATYWADQVPAWRVETQPFVEDSHRDRMHGLDTLNYSLVTSELVPGRILSIDVKAVTADGRTLLQEALSYDPSSS
jgi:hypothetical protein